MPEMPNQPSEQSYQPDPAAPAFALSEEPDAPCEHCVFVPTPGGRCICLPAAKPEYSQNPRRPKG